MNDISNMRLIVHREIEALVAVPLIKACIGEFGPELALEMAEGVIESVGACGETSYTRQSCFLAASLNLSASSPGS